MVHVRKQASTAGVRESSTLLQTPPNPMSFPKSSLWKLQMSLPLVPSQPSVFKRSAQVFLLNVHVGESIMSASGTASMLAHVVGQATDAYPAVPLKLVQVA
eukprot:CAMPEP_0173095842 /NCGR_PEP_ID=MMETSP1102-20130122/32325_1 /TAXON_ID=49646 /ORGANISM="Geminigera sp., Strain Caron Lab Isolate" /LENGTH=100 /DNA_ID=CAMNT_0013986123 /DNA_START=147 /DNA_END=449 /DNA_ORIENTATION=+